MAVEASSDLRCRPHPVRLISRIGSPCSAVLNALDAAWQFVC